MEESVDVKSLRALFVSPASSCRRESESPKSPRPMVIKPASPILGPLPLQRPPPHTALGQNRNYPPGQSKATSSTAPERTREYSSRLTRQYPPEPTKITSSATLGQTREYPGQTREYPGQTKEYPGPTREYPGQTKEYPGQTREYPGQTKENPGQTREYPGQTKEYPGQTKEYPGQTREYPGQIREYPPRPTREYPGHTRENPSEKTRECPPGLTKPTHPGQAGVPPSDSNKVRQTGERLQNMMLQHQRAPGPRSLPSHTLSPPVCAPVRPQLRLKSTEHVAPLRKPLPAPSPKPPKPRRPAYVNIEQWRVPQRGAAGARLASVSPLPVSPLPVSPLPVSSLPVSSLPVSPFSVSPLPGARQCGPPRPPQRDIKPGRLPRQTTMLDQNEDQELYDDIGSLEKNDSWYNTSLQDNEEDEEIYEDIDANLMEKIPEPATPRVETPEGKPNRREVKKQEEQERRGMKKQEEQERREQQERQRSAEQLRKNFQLQLPVDVLHTASVRQDWTGSSKLDLSVRQGARVDIIRVKDNPEGKWLARSSSGNYGYISNNCVDIDYEAIKRRATLLRRMERYDGGDLPPPPPDPPGFSQGSSQQHSAPEDDDNYDDVDFPPPPIEFNMDPKIEKELKKKFKLEGPVKVLHTMMVDPGAILKKPGPKHLSVAPGDLLDILQIHGKKALCRDGLGKVGYVNKAHLLPLEGDVYDEVEYPSDVYDNENMDHQ